MDKALKQRLVGATILILLAVIFLPMVLDGPEPEQNRVISIDTPERPEFDFESRRLPLDEQVVRQSETAEPSTGTASEPDSVTPAVQQPSLDPVPEQTVVRPLGNASDNGGSAQSSPADAEELASPTEPSLSTDAEQVAAPSETPEETSGQPDAPSSAVIQVASFSEAANAERLAAQIRALGLTPSLDTIAAGSGELVRVQVVGLAEADTAAAIQRIRAAVDGVNPKLLDSEALTAAQTPTGDDTIGPGWAVQVGSYSDRENADNMVAQLQSAAFQAFSERSVSGGRELIKVKVGPVLTRDQASRLLSEVQAKTGVEGVVVSYP